MIRALCFTLTLCTLAASARALNVYMVALDGPHAYSGGVPTLSNGSVGNNTSGTPAGAPPSAGGAGMALFAGPSGTGRMGIVIQLLDGTYDDDGTIVQNPNQLATATLFFNQITPGELGLIDLANVALTARNDANDLWHTEAYSTGMVNWVTDVRNGGVLTTPAPLIEDYHLISFDDTAACPHTPGHMTCGGNSFAGRNLWLHTIITLHVRGGGSGTNEARIAWDSGLTEFFNDASEAYGFQPTSVSHGGSTATPGGYWHPVNGRTKGNAFPIQLVPEPASLSLLLCGALLARRPRGRRTR